MRLFLSRHLNKEQVLKYMEMFDENIQALSFRTVYRRAALKERKRTSLNAMRILAICEKINEELQQKQKAIRYGAADGLYLLQLGDHGDRSWNSWRQLRRPLIFITTEYDDLRGFILEPADVFVRRDRLMIIDSNNVFDRQGHKASFSMRISRAGSNFCMW
ncbi:MAG: hypothetical protein MZV63_48635 [Marinilabiliales bacterium]|nr:hypothetical protein [Marinilabiliales bacterium]